MTLLPCCRATALPCCRAAVLLCYRAASWLTIIVCMQALEACLPARPTRTPLEGQDNPEEVSLSEPEREIGKGRGVESNEGLLAVGRMRM